LCDADGELFIKPCTKSEIDFYQSARADYPEFVELIPEYMGFLSLQDPANEDIGEAVAGVIAENGPVHLDKDQIIASVREQVASASEQTPPVDNVTWIPSQGKKIKTDQAVVLRNETYGYKRANILDVKLGTRLYADYAPEQKKERFDQISKETTHHNLGFRIAGMRVFRGSEDATELDDEEYKVYDKDYGRVDVNDENVLDELKRFVFNKTAGIDQELGKAVCAAFAHELARVRTVMSEHESRMYSTSLLFIFEGDGAALRDAIEINNSFVDAENGRTSYPPITKRIDSGIGLDDEDLDDDESDELADLPKMFSLKLIDFAHAAWTPGQGPDDNTIKGVKSLEEFFNAMAE
jgi:1D-myo-inositol-tetrakisphosphate 5-kinase/inositol-polyphosphate multikinase